MKRITWIVGTGFDRNGTVIGSAARDAFISQAQGYLTDKYGGFTMYEGRGAWKDKQGLLVEEDSVTFVVYVTEEESVKGVVKFEGDLYKTNLTLKSLFNQESVLVEVQETEARFV